MNNPVTNAEGKSNALIASFIPHIIRRAYREDPSRKMDSSSVGRYASLLWVDVCNFSIVSKDILENADNGLEELSVLLWNHYDPLLKIVSEGGGEPILYAGDGVLFAWHSESEEMRDQMLQALAVGQKIIENYDVTDLRGDHIQLHVVAAAGRFNLLEIKDRNDRVHISPLGNALNDLKRATEFRAPDHVLLSANVADALGNKVKIRVLDGGVRVLDEKLEANLSEVPSIGISGLAMESLLPYVPESIRYQLDMERIKWISELRPTTLLYVQISGFDPDSIEAPGLLRNAVHIASEIVNSNEGILGQVWIDEKDANFLIYFGPPPTAHRDNPYRGVKTSLELYEALTEEDYHVSIGVVSGTNYCGLLGNDIFRQYTVIGDNVTMSARIARKKGNGIWCDDETKNLTRNSIEYGEYEDVELKGASGLVRVWEPLKDLSTSDFESSGYSIGRKQELKRIMRRWKEVDQGGKAAVILAGESGSGKSKLLDDLLKECARKEIMVLQGKPERIGNKSPYQGVRQIYESILGVTGIIDQKRTQELIHEHLGPELSDQASLLNVVFQTEFADSEATGLLSGLQKSIATRNLMLELMRQFAAKHPVFVIVDDAQWMDDASWDLLDDISLEVDQCMILCVLQHPDLLSTSRKMIEDGATVITLSALSSEDQDKLIASVFGAKLASPIICETIKGIAKGNPFFCIELALAMQESGSIICQDDVCDISPNASMENLKLPLTIKGAVRRKIDMLEPGPEMALKVASVAGQRFSRDLVQDVYPIQNERPRVPEYIEKDNKLGLIRWNVDNNLNEYEFNHSITREVAYETMLREQTVPLHKKTAEWFETKFADNLTPYFSQIAYHWEQAGEPMKAVSYLEREAIRLFSNGFAADSVQIGLDALRLLKVDISRDPQKIGPEIGGNMGVIGALMAGRHPSELLQHKRLENEETEKVLSLLLEIGPFAFQSKQIDLFALLSVTCLRITLEQGNGRMAADVYSMYSVIHRAMTGNRTEGNAWSQLALDLDEMQGGALHSRVAFVHTWFHNHWKNPLTTSLDISSRAAVHGFETGDFLFGCFNLSAHVVYMASCGLPLSEVIDKARESLKVNPRKVMNAAFHLIHEMQQAKAYAGLTEHPLSLSDDEFNEEKDLASICNTEFGNQIGYYLVSRMKLHYHFGDIDGALTWAQNTVPLLPAFEGQVAEIDYIQFKTLALIQKSVRGRREELDCSEEIARNIGIVRSWQDLCLDNFEHKANMLEGYSTGMISDAKKGLELLSTAATQAFERGYLNDLAVIHECAVMIEYKEKMELSHLPLAKLAYKEWGGLAKVKYLDDLYPAG